MYCSKCSGCANTPHLQSHLSSSRLSPMTLWGTVFLFTNPNWRSCSSTSRISYASSWICLKLDTGREEWVPAGQELTDSCNIIELLNKKRSRNPSCRSPLILWHVLKSNRLKEPKKITSPGSSTDPAARVSRVLWAPSGLHGGTFL